jgi:hypothetical protein
VFLVSGWLLLTKETCPTDASVAVSIRTEAQAERYLPACRTGMHNLRSGASVAGGGA